ncbi:MAG: esterase/lipase family protein [Nitrososphaerales archaeon]
MPRLIPIMLVHGFDGLPSTWIESGFRQNLIDNGDLDPNLIRTFDYGIAADGTYNNRGDLREVASRLSGTNLPPEERLLCSVDQLSDNSVARGGPPGVTLIAHSLGGIICRYYLSRNTPDKWGTLYGGKVARLITIGSPHRGVDLARVTDLAPRGSPLWWFIRLLERLGLAPAKPASAVERLSDALRRQQMEQRVATVQPPGDVGPRVLLTDSPVYAQLRPDSRVLAELNQPGKMPADVKCYTFYGDIRYSVCITTNRLTLIDYTVSLGDLLVPAASAREIPYASCTSYPFVYGESISLTLRTAPSQAELRSLSDRLPSISHNSQLSDPDIQKTALSILAP